MGGRCKLEGALHTTQAGSAAPRPQLGSSRRLCVVFPSRPIAACDTSHSAQPPPPLLHGLTKCRHSWWLDQAAEQRAARLPAAADAVRAAVRMLHYCAAHAAKCCHTSNKTAPSAAHACQVTLGAHTTMHGLTTQAARA